MIQTLNTVGFSRRKQKILRDFLDGEQTDHVYVWGMSPVPERFSGQKIIRVEDGFLRSVGLGADLTRPISWVFDDLGIYFDPTAPSRLESILETQAFDSDTLQRARNLISSLVSLQLSKYNLQGSAWIRPSGNNCVILIPGQVETDASIAKGALEIKTNLALARCVRSKHSTAWLVYKPHPDVAAGLRQPGVAESEVALYCDEILTGTDMASVLAQVDEVHTITSLTGFEALLRGKQVHCYGQPFYAGWGLTVDVAPCPRRTRKLTLTELVAGALLIYPTYCSLFGRGLISAEGAIEELIQCRQSKAHAERTLMHQVKRQGLKLYSRLCHP